MSTKIPGQLTVCSYSEFKPVSYGSGQGYEAFVTQKIAKQLGLKLVFAPEAIYEQLWAMPSKKYTSCDVAIGGFSKTQEREMQGAAFSYPTVRFKQSLLIRAEDRNKYRSIKDFPRSKIGVVPGTTGAQYAIQRVKEAGLDVDKVVVYYPSEHYLLPALLDGAIDAIGRGEIGNEYQSRRDPKLITILKRDFGESFNLVVDKNNPQLLSEINQAILFLQDHDEISFTHWFLVNA